MIWNRETFGMLRLEVMKTSTSKCFSPNLSGNLSLSLSLSLSRQN